MADSRADLCLQQHSQMVTERSHFEKTWQEIEDRIDPMDVQFGDGEESRIPGRQNNERVFDATPGLALGRFKAALDSLITPRNQLWSLLKPIDGDLADDIEVKRYLEEVNRRLFAARYAANFATEMQGCYYSGGKYGTMGLFIGEQRGRGLFYRAIPMKQLFMTENEFGVVDLVHRDFYWTARQAYQRFGDRTPSVIKTAAEKNPGQKFRFLHVVKPRQDIDVSRQDYRGMPFVSYYIWQESREVLEEGGFRVNPYAVGRYDLSPGEVYGRSPCMTILPDVKMLNEMNRTTIQAAQLKVLPPLLAHNDGILDAIRLTPAAINYGGVDDNGRQMIQPMAVGGDVNLGLEMMDQKRMVINDALLQTLFQILVDKPNITATEAMLRAQEKGQLIGPTGSRIESELLTPMIKREIDIMAMAGQFDDLEMPQALLDRGGLYDIEFDSPLSRARMAEGGVAVLRTFEQLAPLAAAMGPEAGAAVYKRFKVDDTAQYLAKVNGMPATLIYTDDEMAEIDAEAQQAAQVQQVLQAAPVAASAAKDLAQAQALSATAPRGVAPDIFAGSQ